MAIAALSNSQLDDLKKALVAGVPAAVGIAPAAAPGGGVSEEFCTIWAKAEPILKVVVSVIGFIPGVGSTAGAVLNALIAALDSLSDTVCPKTGT